MTTPDQPFQGSSTIDGPRVATNDANLEQLAPAPGRSSEFDPMAAVAVLAERLMRQPPETGLPAVARLRRLVDLIERSQVDSARAQGWLWRDIARALGVTKQAVHAKHASRLALPQEEPITT
jgi:hypothetical protein